MHSRAPLLAIPLILIFTSCASSPVIQSDSIDNGIDVNEEIFRFEREILQSEQSDTDVFAPNHFNLARTALEKAKMQFLKNESKSEIMNSLAKGEKSLNYADQRADVARKLLKECTQARDTAIAVDAGTYMSQELEDTDDKYLDLARMIENGANSVSETAVDDIVQTYKRIAIQAVRVAYLSEPVKLIKEAKLEGAETSAPESLKIMEKSIANLDTQIRKGGVDIDKIKDESDRNEQNGRLLLSMVRARDNESPIRDFKRMQSFFSPDEAQFIFSNHQITMQVSGLFEPNSSKIREDQIGLLEKVRVALADASKSHTLMIFGSGGSGDNSELSLNRATVVRQFLGENGSGLERAQLSSEAASAADGVDISMLL